VVKNKIAPPFKEAEFDIIYGEGISKVGDVLDLGVAHDIVEKAGPGTPTAGNGSARAGKTPAATLKEHPAMLEEVELKVKQTFGMVKKRCPRSDPKSAKLGVME